MTINARDWMSSVRKAGHVFKMVFTRLGDSHTPSHAHSESAVQCLGAGYLKTAPGSAHARIRNPLTEDMKQIFASQNVSKFVEQVFTLERSFTRWRDKKSSRHVHKATRDFTNDHGLVRFTLRCARALVTRAETKVSRGRIRFYAPLRRVTAHASTRQIERSNMASIKYNYLFPREFYRCIFFFLQGHCSLKSFQK